MMNLKKLTPRLLSASLLLAVSVAPDASTQLSVEPSAAQVAVGEAFSVKLVISGLGAHAAPALSGFDVDLSYDAARFRLVNVAFGAGLGNIGLGDAQTGLDTSTQGSAKLWELSLLEPSLAGCVLCAGPYLEDLQTSTLTLATLNFTAVQAGTASFGLAVNALGDGLGDPLAFGVAAMPSVTAVPVPAAAWLFGSALAGMAAFRRGKRKPWPE